MGQLLCTEKYLPGNIYFIKEGKARLITNLNGFDTTVKKLLPGDLIGIASLLGGKAIEEVRASKELVVYSIEDKKFLQIYKQNLKKA